MSAIIMHHHELIWLFVLAIPIACIAWTVTHEEIFAAPRNYCIRQSREHRSAFVRKCFYVFTCEYCFSHYVTAFFLAATGYTLLLPGWRGYLIGGFSLVWVANIYMGLFGLLRQAIKAEKTKITLDEKIIENNGYDASPVNGKKNSAAKKVSPEHWKDI
ncbi:hypothetical protein [Sediminibacterium soli]|uniref:hypothetical protein n=1 Tax=Sediminibacterium soli TaxID=2698829 RepID=UPI00192A6447|nr:hypothetical protein [Sediminibacterium soli]